MNMIKPDWNKFKAKFSENPQSNFEWFCYLLFCQEFNKPFGIFRYKNQSGIETNPIIKGDEIISWQAKFFSLSPFLISIISIQRLIRFGDDISKPTLYRF